MTKESILQQLGLSEVNSGACGKAWVAAPGGPLWTSINPSTAQPIARVRMASNDYY
jgi:hypothetical protein